MLSLKQIQSAIKCLNQNKLTILPTDTIYGISAKVNVENQLAINHIKKSDLTKPSTILISSVNDLSKFNIHPSPEALKLLLSPEPTTVIFASKTDHILGIRLITRNDIKTIISEVGPIFSSSVNLHGEKPINSKQQLFAFNKEIQVFYDIDLSSNQPSKIYNTITKEWIR